MADEPTPTPTPAPTPAPEPTPAPTPTPEPAKPGEPSPALKTELGTKAPEPKLGPDGKPLPAEKAPEVVPFDSAKLKLPEGMKSDDPLLKTYSGIMSDDKLAPQERGQKLLELYEGAIKQAGEANTLAWTKVNESWVKDVKADPEIGGAKFDTTKATIARAIDAAGPEKAAAFRQALDMTGAGNNPAVWRVLAFWASQLVEGGHVTGTPANTSQALDAKGFFPNSKMS